jgi:hypothetical protein
MPANSEDGAEAACELSQAKLLQISQALHALGIPIFMEDHHGSTHFISMPPQGNTSTAYLDHVLSVNDTALLARYFAEYTENMDLLSELASLHEEETDLMTQIEYVRRILWPVDSDTMPRQQKGNPSTDGGLALLASSI